MKVTCLDPNKPVTIEGWENSIFDNEYVPETKAEESRVYSWRKIFDITTQFNKACFEQWPTRQKATTKSIRSYYLLEKFKTEKNTPIYIVHIPIEGNPRVNPHIIAPADLTFLSFKDYVALKEANSTQTKPKIISCGAPKIK